MLNGTTPKIQHRKWGPTKSKYIMLQSGVDFEIFPKIFVGWFIAFPYFFLLILKADLCAAGFKSESKEAEFNLSLALRSLQTNLDQDLSNARCNSIHFDFDLRFI